MSFHSFYSLRGFYHSYRAANGIVERNHHFPISEGLERTKLDRINAPLLEQDHFIIFHFAILSVHLCPSQQMPTHFRMHLFFSKNESYKFHVNTLQWFILKINFVQYIESIDKVNQIDFPFNHKFDRNIKKLQIHLKFLIFLKIIFFKVFLNFKQI